MFSVWGSALPPTAVEERFSTEPAMIALVPAIIPAYKVSTVANVSQRSWGLEMSALPPPHLNGENAE